VASLCGGERREVAAFRRQRAEARKARVFVFEARRQERREERCGRSTLESFAEQGELAEHRKRLE
jgi:hypothetical protein